MAVMFWGTIYPTLSALPHMRRLRNSRIVNITSIGGKVSVPHLVPYSCAKFAAVAFSEGLRAELHGTGVKVVTIAPGLMRTGSFLNAYFKGDTESEAAWFSASSSLPGLTISAERAARQILDSTRTGRAERVLTTQANLLARFHGMFPGLTTEILGLINHLLPHDGERRARRGVETDAVHKPLMRAITILGRQAAKRFLQPGADYATQNT
jgi:short-subunit dehydrogenase